MNIVILDIRKITDDLLAKKYLEQIAAWHHSEWGNLTDQNLQQFINSVLTLFNHKGAEYFIAVDQDSKQMVGTLSLKKRNMEDEYVDYGWGPWLSGLYIHPDYRHRGISAMLGKIVIERALLDSKKYSTLYYFTHNHNLADFYNQLKGMVIKPAFGGEYTYRKKPILIFKANSVDIAKAIDGYLQKESILFDTTNKIFISMVNPLTIVSKL
jgi:GNAT superfamily N-acetyltransferase